MSETVHCHPLIWQERLRNSSIELLIVVLYGEKEGFWLEILLLLLLHREGQFETNSSEKFLRITGPLPLTKPVEESRVGRPVDDRNVRIELTPRVGPTSARPLDLRTGGQSIGSSLMCPWSWRRYVGYLSTLGSSRSGHPFVFGVTCPWQKGIHVSGERSVNN